VQVYLAIVPQTLINAVISDMQYPYILNSFAYKSAIDTLSYRPTELTLDSGAFTAWNAGKEVDIDLYKDWALELSKQWDNVRCVNLDVIPGEAGRTSTKAERIEGMQVSLENADYLRKAGINVMEVFHQDEPFDFLDLLLDRLPSKESVLCISPRNDVSTKAKLAWHQAVLKHLVDRLGKDNLPKMHGLAVTAKTLMMAFPYFSVDSSSYAAPVRFGRVADFEGKMIKIDEFLGHNFRNDDFGGVSIVIRRMIDEYIRLERQATSLWASRGIVWE
jgi:hypothetical protein